MKIAFGMIVFEGDYVLRECLAQVYPFASQILIAEGPVEYWQKRGRTTSLDQTNEILDSFPDPEKKIRVVHGQFKEKDEQCRAYMSHINRDIDYLWNLDSDEVYKTEDLNKMVRYLSEERPTSVGMTSNTFYGGCSRTLTGFELNTDNFLRIFRYQPGATWKTHRPPTIQYPASIDPKHIDSFRLLMDTGVSMYHYSYVFPDQVFKKIAYYKDSVSRDNCIDDYFNQVYIPWMLATPTNKSKIEDKYNGVHEFKPEVRGPCRTVEFNGSHPESINTFDIMGKVVTQLRRYL